MMGRGGQASNLGILPGKVILSYRFTVLGGFREYHSHLKQ
jgi:hypothetical protein